MSWSFINNYTLLLSSLHLYSTSLFLAWLWLLPLEVFAGRDFSSFRIPLLSPLLNALNVWTWQKYCETAIKCVYWKYFSNISLTFLFYCKVSQNSFLMTSSSPGTRSPVSVVISMLTIWSCWGLLEVPPSASFLSGVTHAGCSQVMLQLSKLMVNEDQKLYVTNCNEVWMLVMLLVAIKSDVV